MERHGVPAIDPFPANLRWPKEDTIVGVVALDPAIKRLTQRKSWCR